MNITITNNSAVTKSYLNGLVSIASGNSSIISRALNVPIASDTGFIGDVLSRDVVIGDGVFTFNTVQAANLLKLLSNFSTDPIATVLLYYCAPVHISQSANTAAGNTVWAMRNPLASPLSLLIERISLKTSFHLATPLFPALGMYELARFSAATPTNGNAITVIKSCNLAAASAAAVSQKDTGLTMTNVVMEAPFAHIPVASSQGYASEYEKNRVCFQLQPGEGFAINLTNQAVMGQSIVGEICWSLR